MEKIYIRQGVHFGTADEMIDRIEALEAENAQLRRALAELATCVEDGCFCSDMRMASAIDDARAALKEKKDD